MVKNSRLKLVIFERGISQKRLAMATGIPQTYISLVVNGKYNLAKEQRQKIADFLGVDAAKIFNSAV